MKSKIRIKTLDESLITIGDRLVDMDLEFRTGPTEPHKGPLQIEVTLRNKEDVESFKTYLGRIVGDLPIPEKRKYKRGAEESEEPETPIEGMVKELKELSTQEEMIEYLRDRNFVFLSTQHIQDMELPIEDMAKYENYQFMVRRIKEAKTPKSDKYDPQLAVGFKILGKSKEKVILYVFGKFTETLEMPWKKHPNKKVQKIKAMVFPPWMRLDEREKWRTLDRKYKLNPELPKSKFYLRWADDIEAHNRKKAAKIN